MWKWRERCVEFNVGVRFFKKIQDWILKSERIRKWVLRFFTKQINPRSLGSCCVKGTEESTSRVDSAVPLTYHDPRNLGLICLVKKRKIRVRILSGLSWIFLKKRTLSYLKNLKCNNQGLYLLNTCWCDTFNILSIVKRFG